MLPIDQVGELLEMLEDEKKCSFDKNYAEEIYRQYNERKTVDDSNVIKSLRIVFNGKIILLVAPGKSVGDNIEIINQVAAEKNVVSIGLNNDLGFDYILTTRADVYSQAVESGKHVIVPSNVSKGGRGDVQILDYKNWIEVDENGRTHDSSAVFAFNLLKKCNVKEIILAGFDGFSTNINNNYYDQNMKRPVNEEQAERRNRYYKNLIERIRQSGVSISFITPSKYE